VRKIVQERTLERRFHDVLFPALLFRADVDYEEAGGNIGETRTYTRTGTLDPIEDSITPGTEPVPQTLNYEQWTSTLRQYPGTIDTHMPTSAVALSSQFLRNGKQLGLQAGQSLNRIARNSLYLKYTQGHTTNDVAAGAGASTLHVRSLNGLTRVSNPAAGILEPQAVSAVNTLSVTAAGITRNIISFSPDTAGDEIGPGTITVDAAWGGAGVPLNSAVDAANAPKNLIQGGALSPLGITVADILDMATIRKAIATLRTGLVPGHGDNRYHMHANSFAEAQIFSDNEWQRLHQSLPDEVAYRELAFGEALGTMGLRNEEVPSQRSVRVGSKLQHIGAGLVGGLPLVSLDGTPLTATIITGYGVMYEFYLDESERFVSEAGLTGKQGVFDISNNAIQIMTDRIRLILRAPVDRMQQVVAQTWTASVDFPVPSDLLSGGPALFKRAIVIWHADV
jgi:hypothetical protein